MTSEPTSPASGSAGRSTRRRRDRHGRGLRGQLVPPTAWIAGREVAIPLSQTRAERFDSLVLDVVEHLEERWSAQLKEIDFAVEDVPSIAPGSGWDMTYDEDVLADQTAGGPVPLGRLLPAGVDPSGARTPPRVVVYRRPLEARAMDVLDLADLVHDVVVEQVARLLGIDVELLDPPPE